MSLFFGNRLKLLRKNMTNGIEVGASTEDFALMLDISERSLSEYECHRSQPRCDFIARLPQTPLAPFIWWLVAGNNDTPIINGYDGNVCPASIGGRLQYYRENVLQLSRPKLSEFFGGDILQGSIKNYELGYRNPDMDFAVSFAANETTKHYFFWLLFGDVAKNLPDQRHVNIIQKESQRESERRKAAEKKDLMITEHFQAMFNTADNAYTALSSKATMHTELNGKNVFKRISIKSANGDAISIWQTALESNQELVVKEITFYFSFEWTNILPRISICRYFNELFEYLGISDLSLDGTSGELMLRTSKDERMVSDFHRMNIQLQHSKDSGYKVKHVTVSRL